MKRLVICTYAEPIRLIKGTSIVQNKSIPSPVEYLRLLINHLELKELILRIHPSESEYFYRKHFSNIKLTFTKSVFQGDYYIGPMSTFFFDSLLRGHPYIIYEPMKSGMRLNGTTLYPHYFNSPLSSFIIHESLTTQGVHKLIQESFIENNVSRVLSFYAPYKSDK